MMAPPRMRVVQGDAFTAAVGRHVVAGEKHPFLVSEMGKNEIFVSLLGSGCRHLTTAAARVLAAQILAACDRAEADRSSEDAA